MVPAVQRPTSSQVPVLVRLAIPLETSASAAGIAIRLGTEVGAVLPVRNNRLANPVFGNGTLNRPATPCPETASNNVVATLDPFR